MNSRRLNILRRCAALLVLVLLGAAAAWSIYISYHRLDSAKYYLSPELMIVITALLAIVILLVKPNIPTICISFILLGICFIFLNHTFYVVDEASQFSYIEFIINHHRIPRFSDTIPGAPLNQVFPGNGNSMHFYEAIQPPLYYFSCAVLTWFIKSVKIRFYICRIIDLCLCTLTLLTVYRSFRYLIAKKIIKDSETLKYVFCLLAFMPIFLTTSVTVTNDAPMFLLAALCFLYLLKIICEDKGYLPLTILLLVLFWTKISTGYFLGILLAVLFVKKKFSKMFLMTGTIAAGISPWLLYNKRMYGDFTGSAEHIAIVRNILNPIGTNVTWVDCFTNIPKYITGFYTGSDLIPLEKSMFGVLASFLAVLIISAVVVSFFYIIVKIIKLRSVFKFTQNEIILGMSVLAILLAYGTMSYVSMRTNLIIITSRAMLCCIIPFLYCLIFWAGRIRTEHLTHAVTCGFTFFIAFLITADVYYFCHTNVTFKHAADYTTLSEVSFDSMPESTVGHEYSEPVDCRSIGGSYLILEADCSSNVTLNINFTAANWDYPRIINGIQLKEGYSYKVFYIPKEVKDLTELDIYTENFQNIQNLQYRIVKYR